MAEWYYVQAGQQVGPTDANMLRTLLAQGGLQPTDLVWREGMTDWLPASEVAELSNPEAAAPQRTVARNIGYYNPRSDKPAGVVPPPNHLARSILVTLCCCLPFGIVGIVQAAQVNGLYQGGDYAGAVAKSESAKKWCDWGMIAWVIQVVISLIFQLIAAGSQR